MIPTFDVYPKPIVMINWHRLASKIFCFTKDITLRQYIPHMIRDGIYLANERHDAIVANFSGVNEYTQMYNLCVRLAVAFDNAASTINRSRTYSSVYDLSCGVYANKSRTHIYFGFNIRGTYCPSTLLLQVYCSPMSMCGSRYIITDQIIGQEDICVDMLL